MWKTKTHRPTELCSTDLIVCRMWYAYMNMTYYYIEFKDVILKDGQFIALVLTLTSSFFVIHIIVLESWIECFWNQFWKYRRTYIIIEFLFSADSLNSYLLTMSWFFIHVRPSTGPTLKGSPSTFLSNWVVDFPIQRNTMKFQLQ